MLGTLGITSIKVSKPSAGIYRFFFCTIFTDFVYTIVKEEPMRKLGDIKEYKPYEKLAKGLKKMAKTYKKISKVYR